MKLVYWVSLGVLFIMIGAGVAAAGEQDGTVAAPEAAQVQELQQRMLGDGEIMAIVAALQADPDVQAVLSDPKVVEAVLAGDLNTLLKDPSVIKLLNNPQVKEVARRLEKPDRGAKRDGMLPATTTGQSGP